HMCMTFEGAVGQEANNAAEAASSKLPVKRVALFNSGVGYFEHRGKVHGEATVDLKFNVDDVNDLLKSMVLEDRGGGQISTVTYGSRDPITKTLSTFAIDLTSDPTLGQLLAQIRGERVEIEAPTKVQGTIVGVEKKQQFVGDEKVMIEVEYLNLLTDEGLRRVPLDSVSRIKLSSAELDAELRRALSVLAMGHATDKKTVTLKFVGEGEREVRVGYIQEAPVWKTSYRLVLDENDKPFLQGWAIVENTTETDWNDVRLSLVSGRPISFVMDLYSPLYADRPTVVPELYASLRPQVYEQDLSRKEERLAEAESRRAYRARSLAVQQPPAAPADAPRGGRASGFGGGGFGGAGGATMAASASDSGFALEGEMLGKSLVAAAQGGEIGELFRYDIKDDVTLARQGSAMLPIINDSVEGEKVSIYNATVHAKHALNGVRLKNSSDLHLMQGPVTVFDGGAYAGDARIPDLPSGSERLLSYALDLEVEVAPTSDARPQSLVSARITKGVLEAEFKQSRTNSYTVKNSGDVAKAVLVEHPVDLQWELRAPKEPTEKTRDVYRFAVAAEPGKPAELKIEEQNTFRQAVAISNLNDDAIHFYLSAKVVPERVKEALREVIRRKSELAELNRQKQQVEQEVATIGEEQTRIRQNMESIGQNTDLYNRYVTKFTEQEDHIERLRDDARALEQQIAQAQRSLDEFLTNLDLDSAPAAG
ncbi:MAG TPA: hypothetical protein VHK01_14810, partial [Lacipirellulaceae bacterium]|nr:hypothetical protein [Lacipirellulaceae bacterium]